MTPPDVRDQLDRAAQSEGERTDPRYTDITPLAKGGMGEVFFARKVGLGGSTKPVVLKTMIPVKDRDTHERHAALFLQEAALSAQLDHPNIVRVTSSGSDLFGDTPYFEMEYVKGISLLELLARRRNDTDKRWGTLAVEYVALAGMQAALGLHHAHRFGLESEDPTHSGVVHRDISLGNIMVSVLGEVKVTDWGITKQLDTEGNASHTRVAAGKEHYMSPEQLSGGVDGGALGIDHRADIYSLGVTLAEMLCGRHLFPSVDEVGLIPWATHIVQGDRPRVEELAPETPEAMRDLLEKMMEPDRDKRPPNAMDVAMGLKPIAIEFGGDLYAVQTGLGKLVESCYRAPGVGKATLPARPGFEVLQPTKSLQRAVSARTLPDAAESSGVARTAPLPAQVPVATTEPEPPEPSSSAAVLAPTPTTTNRRPLLLGALAGSLALLGLVAAVAGFVWGGPRGAGGPSTTTTTAEAAAPHEQTVGVEPVDNEPARAPTEPTATAVPEEGSAPVEPEASPTEPAIEPAQLRVVVVPFGQVALDGRPLSIRRSHTVEPGTHRLVATSGGRRQARTIELAPGQTRREVFRF